MFDIFNLEDCIAFITCAGAKELAECLEKRLNAHNITRTQWIALYYIKGISGITQKQLSEKLNIKEPSVVRLLDKLEALGFVNRLGLNGDKRVKLLNLTEKGIEVEEALIVVVEKFKSDVLEGISDDELTVFKSTLAKMLKNIEQ